MEVRAVAKYVRVQPRKVRIVAAKIKGQPAVQSAHQLRFHPSKGASMLRKVLISAIANAVENHKANAEALRIATISVDEGPRLKRIQARAQGRANRIIKKTSHITVVVEDYEPAAKIKPHGTKAKARPKFEAPKKSKKPAEPKTEEAVAEPTVEEPQTVEAQSESAPEAEAAEETPVEGGVQEETKD